MLGFLAQITISSLAINNSKYYNDPTYGVCTFCYRIDECRASHATYIKGLLATAVTKGLPLSTSSNIDFE